MLFSYKTLKENFFKRSMGDKKIAVFCRQLAILLGTEPLHRILYIMEQNGKDEKYIRMLRDIREQVEEGYPLHRALLKYKESFSQSTVSLIRAGEESGELKEILERNANYLEKQADAKEKFQGALIYPILLMCVTLALLFIMFTFVIPTFVALFKSMSATLPLPTRIMILLGNFISGNLSFIFLSVIFVILCFFHFWQYESFKFKINEFVLKIPLWGNFIKHTTWSKIFITVAMLLRGGFRIDEALFMAEDVSGNLIFKNFLHSAGKKFAEGHSLTTSFRGFKYLPDTHFQLIIAGEKSGHIEEVLLKGAEFSEKETVYILKRIESMIGPILTLIIGGIVLIFVISVLLPIFSLTEIF